MRKKAGKVVLVLTIMATIVAAYYAWRHWQLSRDLTSTLAIALDVDRRTITGKNLTGLPYRYFASYSFKDESGNLRGGRQTIDRSHYDALADRAADAPVKVYFSRSNPSVNTLTPNTSRNTAIVLGLIALLGWGIVLGGKLGW